MKQMSMLKFLVFAILIANVSIVSGEIPSDREVDVKENDLWRNHHFSIVKQDFDYEKRSPLVVNKIVIVIEYDNISVNVEDISRTKARTVLFNVSNGTEVVLVPISLDGR